MSPRTLDQVVREQLGAFHLQLAQLQIDLERLTDERDALQRDKERLEQDLNDLLSKAPSEKESA